MRPVTKLSSSLAPSPAAAARSLSQQGTANGLDVYIFYEILLCAGIGQQRTLCYKCAAEKHSIPKLHCSTARSCLAAIRPVHRPLFSRLEVLSMYCNSPTFQHYSTCLVSFPFQVVFVASNLIGASGDVALLDDIEVHFTPCAGARPRLPHRPPVQGRPPIRPPPPTGPPPPPGSDCARLQCTFESGM